MSEQSIHFSFVSLITMGFATCAIIVGISGHQDFNIATIGAFFLTAIGVFILFFQTEIQHSFSELLDSYIGNYPGMETEYQQTRRFLDVSILLTILVFFSIATWSLGERFDTLFSLSIVSGSGLLGIFFGRLKNGIHSGKSKTWTLMTEDEKLADYRELRNWLSGGHSTTLSAQQMNRIESQRSIFVHEIKGIISDKARLTPLLNELNEPQEKQGLMHEPLIRGPLKKVQSQWVSELLEHIKADKITQYRQLIGSLLTLPVKLTLLEALSTPGVGQLPNEEKARLFSRLLQECEEDAVRLQGFGFSNVSTDERHQIKLNITDESAQFVLFVSKKAGTTELYDFSSGWLHRLLYIFDIHLKKEEERHTYPEHLRSAIHTAVDDFNLWCLCISELLQGRDSSNHLGVPQHLNQLFEEIRDKKTGHFEKDLVLMTWWAYAQLA
ncbi:hypothetical protein N9K65_02450 [Candidatus Poseidoniales archaeon]|nr:hypothetical protein [Candidatus Poseidoniales archaeon]